MLNVLQFSLWYLSNGWADWAEIFRDFSLVHKEAFLEISAQSVQLIRRYRSENCNKLSMDISERGLLSSHRKIWWIWITVTRAVDLLDQMTACYRVKYRTRKCYWPIFAWSLNVKAVHCTSMKIVESSHEKKWYHVNLFTQPCCWNDSKAWPSSTKILNFVL